MDLATPASVPRKPKLAILTNILAPYRLPLYQSLARSFDVHVLLTGNESMRSTWTELSNSVSGIHVHQSWGMQIRRTESHGGVTYDQRHIHLNPGLFHSLRSLRPDAVITAEMGFRTALALLYGRLHRRPVWVWWGGTLHTERRIGAARNLVRTIISRVAPRWISYGQTSTEYLESLGISRDSILQVQNCVDELLYQRPAAAAFDLLPKPVVLCVSRLIGLKGVDKLLLAAAKLQKEGATFSLLIVGEGPGLRNLEELSRRLSLSRCHFAGSVEPDRMPAVYKSADCLVFPALQDVWGLAVNEAIWSGLSVLCSKYAGCAVELLSSEAVFDPLDAASFEDALRRAVSGQAPPSDTSRLQSLTDVAEAIRADVLRILSS